MILLLNNESRLACESYTTSFAITQCNDVPREWIIDKNVKIKKKEKEKWREKRGRAENECNAIFNGGNACVKWIKVGKEGWKVSNPLRILFPSLYTLFTVDFTA